MRPPGPPPPGGAVGFRFSRGARGWILDGPFSPPFKPLINNVTAPADRAASAGKPGGGGGGPAGVDQFVSRSSRTVNYRPKSLKRIDLIGMEGHSKDSLKKESFRWSGLRAQPA